MSAPAPVDCVYDGESFVPDRRFQRVCDRDYVVGERYRMAPIEERSRTSHNHFFACVEEAWKNLPEDLAEQYPNSEKLRKHALIRAGYRDERSIACASKAEAQRVAAFIKPMDDYAIVLVSEAVVTIYTAKSQSLRSMGKRVFQESKEAVLAKLADMVGVQPATLQREAGKAA